MIPQKQLTLPDIFEDCKNIFDDNRPKFLDLLEEHIDLESMIPSSFLNHYHSYTGRKRKYPLTAMLWALILQRILSIPTDSLLLVFLKYSKHLRDFCGFTKVPDAPDEDKSVHDARLLIPTLIDLFKAHPLLEPKTFLGDAAFDSMEIYKSLLTGDTFGTGRHFDKAYIPLNSRAGLQDKDWIIQ